MCPNENELSEESVQVREISFEVIPNAGGLVMSLDLNVKCSSDKKHKRLRISHQMTLHQFDHLIPRLDELRALYDAQRSQPVPFDQLSTEIVTECWFEAALSVVGSEGESALQTFDELIDFVDHLSGLRIRANRNGAKLIDHPARAELEFRVELITTSQSPDADPLRSLSVPMRILAETPEQAADRLSKWMDFLQKAAAIERELANPVPQFELSEPISTGGCREVKVIDWVSHRIAMEREVGDPGSNSQEAEDLDEYRARVLSRKLEFRTDEREELRRNLEEFATHVGQIKEDPYQLKWAIAALHGAAESAMVLALKGTWSVLPWFEDQTEQALRHEHTFVREWEGQAGLRPFMKLFASVKDPALMKGTLEARPYVPADGVDEAMKWLNWFRNELDHFIPKTFSSDIEAAVPRMQHALNVIEFLALQSGKVFWVPAATKDRVSQAIGNAQRACAAAQSWTDAIRAEWDELTATRREPSTRPGEE